MGIDDSNKIFSNGNDKCLIRYKDSDRLVIYQHTMLPTPNNIEGENNKKVVHTFVPEVPISLSSISRFRRK
jgi:hypothetical protein